MEWNVLKEIISIKKAPSCVDERTSEGMAGIGNKHHLIKVV